MKHIIQKHKEKKIAKTCVYATKNIFGIRIKKTSLIWDHGKNTTIAKEIMNYILNYNSKNNSLSKADMMEKKLKWNKQQNLDDENQKITHNIEF